MKKCPKCRSKVVVVKGGPYGSDWRVECTACTYVTRWWDREGWAINSHAEICQHEKEQWIECGLPYLSYSGAESFCGLKLNRVGTLIQFKGGYQHLLGGPPGGFSSDGFYECDIVKKYKPVI
jgi:hypothetical protein